MNHRIAEFTRICCTMGVGNCQLLFWVDSCLHAVKRRERKARAQLITGMGLMHMGFTPLIPDPGVWLSARRRRYL